MYSISAESLRRFVLQFTTWAAYVVAGIFVLACFEPVSRAMASEAPVPKKVFICPPCDHECDNLIFEHPGRCPQCGMTLVEKGEARAVSTPNDFAALEQSIQAKIDSGEIPSATVALGQQGRIVYERAFGWADKERKRPAKISTPYALASATKPVVATALMLLSERRKVDLDAPALRYAGGWRATEDPLNLGQAYTLRQVLNHTAGLCTYASISWHEKERATRSLADAFARYGFVVNPPGVIDEYSNMGYGLLGHIVAEQSGMSLADFLSKEIFAPLGMSESFMEDSFATPPEAAQKYDISGRALSETYNDTAGGGNLYTSAHDLALFGLFHLSRETEGPQALLSPQTKDLMHSYIEPGVIYPYYNSSYYGLGWYFRKSPAGQAVVCRGLAL